MGRFIATLIFGLAGVAILVALGVWQVQRLTWKEAILSDIETRIAAEPVQLPADPDRRADRYLPVELDGRLTGDEIHVLVSAKGIGAGYRIIAAFETGDGRRIMVDRGIVPDEAKDAERPTGPAEIAGNLHWPDEIDAFTPDNDRDGNIWFARDVPAMAASLGTEPILVIARTDTGGGVVPLPVDTAGIPNDHLEYAITWFSLAVIWAGMTAALLWRMRRRTV